MSGTMRKLLYALPWAVAFAQSPAPPYGVVLASATTQAINYPFIDGSTLIGFRGTALEPSASGQASVRGDGGRMRIHAHFSNLGPATQYGPEYLTYVLWSISPLGRPANLGEVVVKRGKAHVEAMTNLQSFGLIVSAEPHFAVTRVSNAVVLENIALREPRNPVEQVEARYELLGRGTYTLEPGWPPMTEDGSVSPYVFQARNAVRIARVEQAEALAPAEYRMALDHLNRMEGEKLGRKKAVLLARCAVQHAEDARLVADKQRDIRALAQERRIAQEAVARAEAAQAKAAQESQRAYRQEEAARKATDAQLAVRQRLMDQMNRLLQTRETDEGLLAALTDVAFPSGKSQLTSAARVNLAKVAGILLAQPGLQVKVLGHTDATGSPAFNLRLSQQRAFAVRQFLLQQGLAARNVGAQGVNGAHPIASDATPEGRRQNRRVDLIVSGEPIGLGPRN